MAATIVICISCERDSEYITNQELKQVKETKREYVSISDVPQIIPTIQRYNNAYDYLAYGFTGPITSRDSINLDLDLARIIKVTNPDGKESYNIAIKQHINEFTKYYFENLHIIETADGYKSFICKYETEDGFVPKDFNNYTGKIEIYDKERNFQGVVLFENGQKVCDKVTLGCITLIFFGNGDLGVVNECTGGGGDNPSAGGPPSEPGNWGPTPGNPGSSGNGNHGGGINHPIVLGPNVPLLPANPLFMTKVSLIMSYLRINENVSGVRQWLVINSTAAIQFYTFMLNVQEDETMLNLLQDIVVTSQQLDINALNVWIDVPEYENRMSSTELIIFRNMPKNRQMWYLVAAQKATDKSEEFFPPTAQAPCSLNNGIGDAFRHACWNAVASELIGEELTAQLTTAHEEITFTYPLQYKVKDMDLYNNAVGIGVSQYSNINNVVTNVKNACSDGLLRYLNNTDPANPLVPCAPTTGSYLTPSNQ